MERGETGMTRAHARKQLKILGYLQKWQRILKLEDWQLCIEWSKEASPRDATMMVWWPRHYQSVDITVYPCAFKRSPLVLEQTACHEMLHLLFAPEEDALVDLIGKETEVFRRWHDIQERTIDRLAVVLANSFESKSEDAETPAE